MKLQTYAETILETAIRILYATRLSDESIDKIGRIVKKKHSMNEEEKEGAQSMLDCLDIIIKSDI